MPPREERPLAQREARTLFLRVPSDVWPQVASGRVREFRAAIGNVPQFTFKVELPTLVVAYRKRKATAHYDHKLMTLEGVRREELRAITEEGLALAGYHGENARARFRRDWMLREKRKFEPTRKVVVFTVRPVIDGDLESTGRSLVERLYGEFLENGVHEQVAVVRA